MEGDANDSSSFTRLPDEIILQILSKLIDLKTLCFCHLVSRRFSAIVVQVDTISFIAPLLTPPKNTSGDVDGGGFPVPSSRPLPRFSFWFYDESFRSAVSFLSKFRGVKSLCIELPSSSHRGIDNRCLLKWKVKFGNRIDSFLFLSPDSICDTNGLHVNSIFEEEEGDMELSNDLYLQKIDSGFQCLKDVIERHKMLLYFIKNLPMLEKVSITDSGKRGRLSLNEGKLSEVREWIHSAKPLLHRIEVPVSVSRCCVPVLEMPVSGYVMKGVMLVVMEMNDIQGGNDGFMNREDGFEDKEEAVYSEAVVEILEKHKGSMERLM